MFAMRILFFLLSCIFYFQLPAQNLKSGGVLKPEQAIMDIRHYGLTLDVDPLQKTINLISGMDLPSARFG